MLHIFSRDGKRSHCLAPGHRCKHHTVCKHPHNRDEAPELGQNHHCLHAPDGTHVGYVQPTHAVDCACAHDDCRHLRAFLAQNADKGLSV